MNYLRFYLVSLFAIHCALCLEISPKESEITLIGVTNFSLTCTDNENITWTYPTKDYGNTTHNLSYEEKNGTHILTLTASNIDYMDTGYYYCEKQVQKNDNESSEAKKHNSVKEIYVYVFDNEHYLAVSEEYSVLQPDEFGNILIPCRPTLPNLDVKLFNSDDETEINLDYDPKKGFTFKSPKVKDSRVVKCVARSNNSNSTERLFDLIIHTNDKAAKPLINSSAASHPVEGKSITLNCTILLKYGSQIFITWKYPNDDAKRRAIEGEQIEISFPENSLKMNYKLLTFPNLSRSDEGEYTCEVEDLARNKESTTYYLGVFAANHTYLDLTILTDLTNDTKKAGEAVIQWMLNITSHPQATVVCEVPSGDIINTDSPPTGKYWLSIDGRFVKFVVNNLDVHDTGTYKFIADNGYHRISKNISLYVEDAPAVKMKKLKQVNFADEPSEIECNIIAYPRPKITWSAKKCHNYPSCETNVTELISQNIVEEPIKPYELKSTLRYQANDTTILYCTASNTEGSNSSHVPFYITDMADGYSVSKFPNDITVGDNVKLTCGVSKYFYNNSIIWHFQRDSKGKFVRLQNSTNIKILPSETRFSYQSVVSIPNSEKSHSGLYQCNADPSGTPGENSENSVVEVIVKDVMKPIFLSSTNLNGSSLSVNAGKEIQMRCQVDGMPKPTVVWYKNDEPVVILKNDSRIALEEDNQLFVIKFADGESRGKYKCIATNKVGNITAVADLIVKGLPHEDHDHRIYIILPAVLTISLTVSFAWLFVRMQKERKLRKKLRENILPHFPIGAVDSLNPELGIEEQADLLPYDSRWEFPRDKLKLGKQLGSGAFGVVLKAEADGIIDPDTTTVVAVKMVKRGVDALYLRALASELKIMIHLGRHLNVVNLLGACTKDINKRELAVIVEYCKYGNLHDFLLKQRGNFINQIDENGQLDFSITENKNSIRFSSSGAVENTSFTGTTTVESVTTEGTLMGSDGYLINKDSEPDWRSNYCGDYRNITVRPIKTSDLLCWSFQIARGMEYLASRKVLHGDLAARNVLLADDNIVKICDFGLAKSMYASDNYKRQKNQLLPVRWMAIESIRDRVFSIQSDVWSFGITMWELFSLSVTPYPGVEHLETLYAKLEDGYRLEKPAYATKEIHNIMLDCWHKRPTMRPLFTDLCEKIGELLENGVQSHYTNLNEVYLQMNANTCNGVDYLSLLNPPVYSAALEEPRYVNLPSIPSRESSEPEDDVELKPMLNNADNNYINAKPFLISNPNYMEINRPKIPAYVNTPI